MIYDINGNDISSDNTVLTYYVSTNGSDNNNGLSAEAPLATVGRALSRGAERIYIASGTYTEFVRINKPKTNIEIICTDWNDPAVFTAFDGNNESTRDYGLEIANGNRVQLRNITMLGGRLGACYIHDCYDVYIERCEASQSTAGMGFKLTGGCYVKFDACKANNNAIDGFNIHGASVIECYNCYAEGNLDDGFSNHESTKAIYENCIAVRNQNGITPVMGAETYINGCIACDNDYDGLTFAGQYTGPITMRNCLSVRNGNRDYALGGNSALWMYNYNNVDTMTFVTSSINRIPNLPNP